MTQFNVGDVVRLKSGGPAMTVTKTRDMEVNATLVDTTYMFNGDQKWGQFFAECLEKVPASTDNILYFARDCNFENTPVGAVHTRPPTVGKNYYSIDGSPWKETW